MIDFRDVDYLKQGNDRQKLAYNTLKALNIFESLQAYKPLLAGTIPLEIDTPDSDLDIICQCDDHETLAKILLAQFSDQPNFQLKTSFFNGVLTTIAKFKTTHFWIEVFAQNTPPEQQHAYRHLLIEYHILAQKDTLFRQKIIQLKTEGMKTEPAFAKLLGLTGDPYEELLKLEKDIDFTTQ